MHSGLPNVTTLEIGKERNLFGSICGSGGSLIYGDRFSPSAKYVFISNYFISDSKAPMSGFKP